jgi:hypothetical protein
MRSRFGVLSALNGSVSHAWSLRPPCLLKIERPRNVAASNGRTST